MSIAQTSKKAASYMQSISKHNKRIEKETLDYLNSMVHSKSAKKVNRDRLNLINAIEKALAAVKELPPYEDDSSLRDSVVAYLNLSLIVINNDFEKIIDMEEVAEQSYDFMEAYILAQELANSKLEAASDRLNAQYKSFAEKNGVNLIENTDPTSQNLKRTSEALRYYNRVYLVFFKAFKQEVYLLDAINRNDINSIEQNRNALASVSREGIDKLKAIGAFRGDKSILSSTNNLLLFYIEEAEKKIPIIVDFLQMNAEFTKMMALMESKDKNLLSEDETKHYNKAIKDHNKAIKTFNSTNNELFKKRNKLLNSWNVSVSGFMNKQVPKKK